MPGRLLGFDLGKTTTPTNTKSKVKQDASKRTSVAAGVLAPSSNMDQFIRPSLNRSKHSSETKAQRTGSSSGKHVKLDLVTESPPALLLDDPQRSSGALYSVKLRMDVKDKPVTLKSFTLKLEAVTTHKRPVSDKCPSCSKQVAVVKEWKLVSGSTSFRPGSHEFPASHLIPGHLPASVRGQIGSIEYQFVARAETEKGDHFDLTKPLEVQRAVRPGPEKVSIRVFPPTNLNLNVTLPSVIHPMGDFNVYAKMTGLTTKNEETQTRWRLRKLDWRIEEHETGVSPACSKHAQKVGGEGKGVLHENTRVIGDKEVKGGWKCDFEAGEVEGEFVCAIDRTRKPNADVDSPNGLKISHVLILEMIIAEEWAPNKKPKNATPTGVARVLRTQFNLTVTERAGMGIAWDDETPPMYEDVPASPPAYLHMEDYDADSLNDDVDHLHLGS
ncbi:hypothetical protein BDZ85DRAFT_258028 [Elsinoe ampelina]|uniref:LDB19 N-terminal domain-containing protein n=1 Tax=Elsinoe ampelina TaxID=302913 RepID=A0A6A6GJD4_9PEZI|nr:hypothetical protein BDZ85DRAFT_258028 [Elsinoe ampelina]